MTEVIITGNFSPDDGWLCELKDRALPTCPDCAERLRDTFIYDGEDPSSDAGEDEIISGCGSAFTIVRGILGASNWLRRRRYPA
jgi:hypothetical protein